MGASGGWKTGRSILQLARSLVWHGALVLSAVLLAVSARPAEAAVTFVKSLGTAASATTGTTIGVTVPAGGAAAGNSIILTLSLGDAPGDVSAADTSGNAYSLASDVTNAAHVRTVILAAHNVSALAAGSTITITYPSVSASAMSAAEFSGISKVAALDRASSATGTGTSPSSGLTQATTLASELLIGAIGVEGPLGDAFTAGAGFTGLPRAGTGIGVRGASSGSVNGSSLSIAAPAGVVAGDVLLASVDVEGGSGTTITASGWTLVRRDNSSTVLGQATYYRVAGAPEPASYSFGISPSRRASGGIIAYTNVDNASPINASGGKVNASSSSITAPSITTTAAYSVVVGFFGIANNGTITPPAGLSGRYSASSSNILGSAGADGFQTVAGATGTKVATCTGSAVSIGHLVALTPTIPSSFATINPEYRIVSSAAAYQAGGTLGASKDWAAAIATFRQGVCGDGFTDPGESCDLGASNGAPDACCSATCAYKSSGTQCRSAVDECDKAETCSGSSAVCPADTMKASGTACSSDGNACTKDQCNGASVTCQHPAATAGTVCRAAAGVCDAAETCTGTDTTCPVDNIKASGTVCRAAAGVCDVAETCTGTTTTCPVDGKQPSGTACAADSNPCTLDQCNGTSVSCQHPAGNAGTVCRAAAGACDVADTCTGASTSCPTDAKLASGTVCRPAAGDCDVAESCTGQANCPDDVFKPSTTVCRASAVICDYAEYCNASASCPADTYVPGTTACWAQNLGTNGNETPSTLISIPVAGNVILGRTVIVTVAMDPNAGAVTCADNKGNTYSRDVDTTNGSGTTGVRALAFSAPVTNALQTGDTITVTFQNSTACKAVSVAEFVGIAGVDQTAGAIGNDISPSSGPTSPTAQPNELLLGVIGVETKLNQKFTGGAGYTVLPREQSDPNAGSPGRHVTIDPEYQFVRETGSYAANGTLSGPRLWAASIVTYRSGIGGPGSICGNGDLEQGEECDAGSANGTSGSCCTASCTVSDAGQVCRAAAGACDFAETCTGLSAACPADEQLPAGSACADDGNPCTVDVCNGFDVACGHPAGNAGLVCRPATSGCDLAESCDGAANVCPVDAVRAAGFECRPASGACDLAESCDGAAHVCPVDTVQPAGTECRPATGACDLAESCDGAAHVCPVDALQAAGTVCRPAAGGCDLAESCDGAANVCPVDTVQAAGTECRPATGECDLAESCDGAAGDCPEDAFQAAATECRPSTANCDPAESCTGTAASCPADDFNQPSEVTGVALARDPSTTTIAWTGDFNDLFNVYRGSRRAGTAWSYNQSCIETAVAGLSVTDTLDPGTGTVFYYLVSRVEGQCGESVLGRSSIATLSHDVPMVGQCLGAMVDNDGDGVEDALDNCPVVANPDQTDVDQDEHGDVCDNCPNDFNSGQINVCGLTP